MIFQTKSVSEMTYVCSYDGLFKIEPRSITEDNRVEQRL